MSNPSELNPSGASSFDVPQFSTAEYTDSAKSSAERCSLCSNLLAGQYYRLQGKMVCASCAQQASAGQLTDSHQAFTRGLLFGIGAAIVGLAAYATFTIVTGWYLGYIALGVGWIVAKAIQKGSGGIGGRRYQIAAVLLTYAAISVAAIPIGMAYFAKHPHTTSSHTTGNAAGADSSSAQANPAPKAHRNINAGALVAQLILWGLASPFLELANPVHGAIGLFILFIGLQIAWKITAAKPLALDGPYSVTAA